MPKGRAPSRYSRGGPICWGNRRSTARSSSPGGGRRDSRRTPVDSAAPSRLKQGASRTGCRRRGADRWGRGGGLPPRPQHARRGHRSPGAGGPHSGRAARHSQSRSAVPNRRAAAPPRHGSSALWEALRQYEGAAAQEALTPRYHRERAAERNSTHAPLKRTGHDPLCRYVISGCIRCVYSSTRWALLRRQSSHRQ